MRKVNRARVFRLRPKRARFMARRQSCRAGKTLRFPRLRPPSLIGPSVRFLPPETRRFPRLRPPTLMGKPFASADRKAQPIVCGLLVSFLRRVRFARNTETARAGVACATGRAAKPLGSCFARPRLCRASGLRPVVACGRGSGLRPTLKFTEAERSLFRTLHSEEAEALECAAFPCSQNRPARAICA